MADGRGHRTPLALRLTPPTAAGGAAGDAAAEALARKGAYVQRCVCMCVNELRITERLTDCVND